NVAYTISVDHSGETCSIPTNAGCTYTETLSSGQGATGDDFGLYRTTSLSGTVFEDGNANGHADTGDSGLGSWTVYVDYNDNGTRDGGEPWAISSVGGSYQIDGIKPGTYTVREMSRSGYTCTECSHRPTLASGDIASGEDFGNAPDGSVSGTVFEDLNADGA